MTTYTVLSIGWDPDFADLSGFPDLTPAKVRAGLTASKEQLDQLGYVTDLCLITSADTAETTVLRLIEGKTYDCVVFGAGLRSPVVHNVLFEKLINLVHARVPGAKLCFNTKPTDTVDAVRRQLGGAAR